MEKRKRIKTLVTSSQGNIPIQSQGKIKPQLSVLFTLKIKLLKYNYGWNIDKRDKIQIKRELKI